MRTRAWGSECPLWPVYLILNHDIGLNDSVADPTIPCDRFIIIAYRMRSDTHGPAALHDGLTGSIPGVC